MATDLNRDAYNELCCHTLSHDSADFIHQHVVDAFAAQDATTDDKPTRLAFALVGLYLHVEKRSFGQVQCLTRQSLTEGWSHEIKAIHCFDGACAVFAMCDHRGNPRPGCKGAFMAMILQSDIKPSGVIHEEIRVHGNTVVVIRQGTPCR